MTTSYINPSTGRIWNDPSSFALDSMARDYARQSDQMVNNAIFNLQINIIESRIKEDNGAEKIRSGRATTKIAYSPQNSIVEEMVANASSLQEKQQMRQAVTIALQTFNNILKAKGLIPYDMSDGDALSFVLSYLVYKDEDPSDMRLRNQSKENHTHSLKDPLFQGTPDAEKQKIYEMVALKTMLGLRLYEKSKRTDITKQEREKTLQTAKSYAESVLRGMWRSGELGNLSLSPTGFADKGEIIVSGGRATSTFVRSSSNSFITFFAERFNTAENNIIKLLQEFDEKMKSYNGLNNDAAWANAVAFALAYEVYTNGKVKLNQQQVNWVLREMQNDLLSDKNYQSNTNEQKQRYYEFTALQTMFIVDKFHHEGYTNDIRRETLEKLREIFQPRNFDEYTLISTGFVKNK